MLARRWRVWVLDALVAVEAAVADVDAMHYSSLTAGQCAVSSCPSI